MSTASVPSMIWMILILFSAYHVAETEANECSDRKCGDMNISFPFRKGKGDPCGLPGFEIDCKKNKSFGNRLLPFLRTLSGDVQIVNISDNYILVNSTPFVVSSCESLYDGYSRDFGIASSGPFRISDNNTFVTVGCGSIGGFWMIKNETYESWNDVFLGVCASLCLRHASLTNCNGDGCCLAPVPRNYAHFFLYTRSQENLTSWESGRDVDNTSNCSYAAIVDVHSRDSFSGSGKKKFIQKMQNISMRLDWAISNQTCSKGNTSSHCDQNAECIPREWGIMCKCRKGYNGDGYKKGTKCQDVDECSDPHQNECKLPQHGGGCVNTEGSYKCFCSKGHGDGLRNGTCENLNSQNLPLTIGVSVTLVAVVAVLAVSTALFWIKRRRKLWLTKQNNFRHNGGERLQSLISSRGEATRIFSLDEIEKATDKFSESLVLGTGGYGTVYKGILPDGLVVAIKKSKTWEVDSKEIDQFINEIVILSKVNHRYVVKILGCCLESPVPLLVYEYISNGTLFEHLYDDKYEQGLQWKDRLRIATETAEALSYLHSAASIPIIHRDVKSSNILLDHGLTPKVADFGVSRLVPTDQTHVTTAVQGTMGYLDPEYFQTVRLTEKSDVYSFGVVLAELITGLKPVSYERTKNDSNLAIYFLSKMKTQDLADIIDSRLNLEDSRCVDSMQRVANLAKECLNLEGEKRPTMKEVVQELLWISGGSTAHFWADGNAAGKGEEMVALIVEDVERSDDVQIFTTTAEMSMVSSTSTTRSFGIEGFKESLRGDR